MTTPTFGIPINIQVDKESVANTWRPCRSDRSQAGRQAALQAAGASQHVRRARGAHQSDEVISKWRAQGPGALPPIDQVGGSRGTSHDCKD
eukprot:scaffold146427_cov33-Tisochrysis_lutea.AAC.3